MGCNVCGSSLDKANAYLAPSGEIVRLCEDAKACKYRVTKKETQAALLRKTRPLPEAPPTPDRRTLSTGD